MTYLPSFMLKLPNAARRVAERVSPRRLAGSVSPLRPAKALPVTLLSYSQPRNLLRNLLRLAIIASLLVFCLFYGAAFALFAPYLIAPLALPLLILFLFVVWALPDSPAAPLGAIDPLFYIFIVSLVVWPNYLALALPGLPWVTLIRITGFPMAGVFLLCLAMSSEVRRYLSQVIRDNRIPFICLAVFVFCQLYTIAFSHHKGASIQKFILFQVDWTAVFFIAVWCFRRPGRLERWAGLLWCMGIFVGLIGAWEHKLHRLPWAGHIPSFLKMDADAVAHATSEATRRYTGILRVQSTFGTSLGLSEYIALIFPFVAHFALFARQNWVRLAAIVTMPFLVYVVIWTDSRLGFVGCFLTVVLFPLVIGIKRQRDRPQDIIGRAILLAYPAAFCVALASTFVVPSLKRHIWGGGAQQNSTSSRFEQYKMGFPKIWHNPLGYGPGEGGDTLGYAPYGFLTIDTYYLLIALEYGVLGFIAYYGLIATGIWKAAVASFTAKSDDPDLPFLMPLAISLLNFFVIKSIFSQQDNHPLAFAMLGMVIAICFRLQRATARPAP